MVWHGMVWHGMARPGHPTLTGQVHSGSFWPPGAGAPLQPQPGETDRFSLNLLTLGPVTPV